jgi:hypothetical protein
MGQTVTPLPSIGDVISGRDVPGRELRISGHPESDRVVLSIWQDGRCQATVRLARSDVPEVTRALVAGLVPLPAIAEPDGRRPNRGRTGTVHELHRGQGSVTTEVAADVRTRADQSPATRLRELGTRILSTLQEFRAR